MRLNFPASDTLKQAAWREADIGGRVTEPEDGLFRGPWNMFGMHVSLLRLREGSALGSVANLGTRAPARRRALED